MLRKAIPLLSLVAVAAVLVHGDSIEQTYVPGQVIVQMRPAANTAALGALGYAPAPEPTPGDYTVMSTRPGQTVEAALAELSRQPDVLAAQPNYIYRAQSTTPNDPSYYSQWHLRSIRCPDAWDLGTAAAGETIAIIDSGEDTSHTDLAARFTYVPFCDIIDGDSNPYDDGKSGHGTATAGVAGAIGNNGLMQSGVIWDVPLMPIRVLSGASATGTSVDVDSGIRLAIRSGARVLNLSFGFSTSTVDNVVEQGLTLAQNAKIIVVASAGNNGTAPVIYPASSTRTIAVGATTSTNARAGFSNYGAASGLNGLDVMAPGDSLNVLAMSSGETSPRSGTSYSAPIVSAMAAMVRARRPGLTPDKFLEYLRSTATDIGDAGYDAKTGAGLANLLRLMQVATASTSYGDSLPAADTKTTAMATGGRQSDQCLPLSATDSYAGFAGRLHADTGSIQFYFRPDETQASGTLYILTQRGALTCSSGNIALIYRSDRKLDLVLTDSATLTSRTALVANQWYHIAITYGPAGLTLYVNGDSEAWSAVTGGPRVADTLYLGAPYSFGNAQSARGRFDRLAFGDTQSRLFPAALYATVEAPAAVATAVNMLGVSWRAFETESNAITVSIYADTDNSGYNGTLLASGCANDQYESVALTPLTLGHNYYIYVIALDTSTATHTYPDRAYAYSPTYFTNGSPPVVVVAGSTGSKSDGCLLARSGWDVSWCRALRDRLLASRLGRLLTAFYYLIAA